MLALAPTTLAFAAADAASGCGLAKGALVEISPRLVLGVCSDSTFRVVRSPGEDAKAKLEGRRSLMVRPGYGSGPVPQFSVTHQGPVTTTVSTSTLKAIVDMASEHIEFFDAASGVALTSDFGHSFEPTSDPALKNASSYIVSQSFKLAPNEGIFGGGQYQSGIVGFQGVPVEMVQYNTEAVVPFFASTQGYGLLWDNNAWSHLNPPNSAPLVFGSPDKEGTKTASFTPNVSGDHALYADMCQGFGCGGTLELSIEVTDPRDGTMQVVQQWEALNNLPDAMSGRALGLVAGVKYEVRLRGATGTLAGEKVFVAPPPTATTLSSELGQLIDYYFTFAGAKAATPLDGAIAGYREITGEAPLYARFAYGFWQCKEHYKTQDELLNAAARFRQEKIPLDAIVQDWHCTPPAAHVHPRTCDS